MRASPGHASAGHAAEAAPGRCGKAPGTFWLPTASRITLGRGLWQPGGGSWSVTTPGYAGATLRPASGPHPLAAGSACYGREAGVIRGGQRGVDKVRHPVAGPGHRDGPGGCTTAMSWSADQPPGKLPGRNPLAPHLCPVCVAGPGQHQRQERRAPCEQDEEDSAGPVIQYQRNGTCQHGKAGGSYRAAIPCENCVAAAWRRVPGTHVLRVGHGASSASPPQPCPGSGAGLPAGSGQLRLAASPP